MEVISQGGTFGTLDDVVAAYTQWLEVKANEHFAAFTKRLRTDAEAARAEAALFSLMRAKDLKPFPAEDPSTGGADFACYGSGTENPIVVEVTVVRADAVAAKSGLAKKLDIEVRTPSLPPYPMTTGMFVLNNSLSALANSSGSTPTSPAACLGA